MIVSNKEPSQSAANWLITAALFLGLTVTGVARADEGHSVARQWNEALLDAIGKDFARPTVHARNLYHTSVAMWDAWAAFDSRSHAVLHIESMNSGDLQADRETAISHAAYRLLRHRFATSPGNDPDDPDHPDNTLMRLRALMVDLGHNPDFNDANGETPESLGVRIANTIIQHGLDDGANEANGYVSNHYLPLNPELNLDQPGNPDMVDTNRWQPLQRDEGFVDQSGNQVGAAQVFLGPEWGSVKPFSLGETDREMRTPPWSDASIPVYFDPGTPPLFGGAGDAVARSDLIEVIYLSSLLDPVNSTLIDISPASIGNNSLGANDGSGYDFNPATGEPYAQTQVLKADYYRVIAEYWADGPASATPPGHWFALLNEVSDHPLLEHRMSGSGPLLDRLEWDVKSYLAMGGAMHDAAISAWSNKGYYDSSRPISAIRLMAGLGQSTDANLTSWHPMGLPLEPGLIELITPQSVDEHHAHLGDHIGEIAIRAWRGHGHDPETQTAGVDWILGMDWWPYQQPDFVTPPFAGYVSGHSTFSRAAAEIMTMLTGDSYFPGGLGERCFDPGFLEFEAGPTSTICLQWAKYFDASDQSGISRIAGGIHPGFDDLPGRLMGHAVAQRAWSTAQAYFAGEIHPIFRDSFMTAP